MIKQKLHRIIQNIFHSVGYDIQYYSRGFIKFIRKHYQKKDLVGIEIGVYKGENAVSILKLLPIKRLYLIDPYQSYTEFSASETEYITLSQKDLNNAKIQAFRRLSKFKDKIVWINEISDIAYKKIPEQLDLIYIDGNHSYEFVKRDMENYYTLLKENGILAGHDIDMPDVLSAFIDFVKEKSKEEDFLCRIVGSDWIITKGKIGASPKSFLEKPCYKHYWGSDSFKNCPMCGWNKKFISSKNNLKVGNNKQLNS